MDGNARRQGLLIARNGAVVHLTENKWSVSASSSGEAFRVDLNGRTCACKPGMVLVEKCAHMYAVEARYGSTVLSSEEYEIYSYYDEDPEDDWTDWTEWSHSEDDDQSDAERPEVIVLTQDAPATKGRRKTYSQNWAAYNKGQVNEKDLFLTMLSELVGIVEQPAHTSGRPPVLLGDAVFACAYKVYSLYSARRFSSDLRHSAEMGYITDVLKFNTLNKYMRAPALTKELLNLIAASTLPLRAVEDTFAIDSSGFSTSGKVTWFNKRWGKEIDNRVWIKLHISCGTKTNIIASASVSEWYAHDTTYFASLMGKTSEDFDLSEVSADRAYLSHANLELAWLLGAVPFVPFKSNTVPVKKDGTIWAAMYDMYTNDHENWKAHYHQRSNSETVFSMIDAKLTKRIRSKDAVGQVNEALCKVLCHNIMVLAQEIFELGIVPDFATGKSLKARIDALI